ncbi:MAG: efflux RND transporter periplasmic adaptor subunit [Undibacterium sp.]
MTKSDLKVLVSGSGQVEADSQVDLKPVVAGDAIEVTTVAVKNDQEVKKGQIIAVLDNQDAARDVVSAELGLHQAEIKAKQAADLYSKLDRDDARQRQIANDAVRQSELSLQKVRNRLQDYTVRAPFDGIVTGLTVDSGDTISQTGILASVITKKLHVLIELNEVDAAKVNEGSAASLSFVALPGVVISGKLVKLDTIGTITQNVVSYTAEIELEKQPEGLKPGMSTSADILVADKSGVLVVPNAALSSVKGKTMVTVVPGKDGTTGEKREVVVGLANETVTEIVSGLSEGATVSLPTAAVGTAASGANASSQGSILNLFRGGTAGSNRTGGTGR